MTFSTVAAFVPRWVVIVVILRLRVFRRSLATEACRFPAAWIAEEADACFIVREGPRVCAVALAFSRACAQFLA